MDDKQIKALEEKIKKARGLDEQTIKEEKQEELEKESRQGVQAGVELVGAIFIPAAIGYYLDQWLGTKPAFMLILLLLGVCTGFYNVYRVSKNIGTAVGAKESKTPLRDDKKNAK